MVSDKVQLEWYQAEVRAKAAGRRAAYCRVREAELRAELAATHGRRLTPIQTARHLIDTIPLSPAPFAKLSLRPFDISIITRVRCHMLSCIRTHCGHQAHVLRRTKYHPIAHWHLYVHACSVLAHALTTTSTSSSVVRSMLTPVQCYCMLYTLQSYRLARTSSGRTTTCSLRCKCTYCWV